MNDMNEMQLMRAYELIEAGDLAGAQAIIEPLLIDNRNNADTWWIYAHAVDDVPSARNALDNVLRIDPHYPGAKELRAQIAVAGGEVAAPPMPATLPDTPSARPVAVSESVSAKGADEDEKGSNPLIPILAVVALIAIVIVALLLLQQPAEPVVDSTPVAVNETPLASTDIPALSATEEVDIASTEVPVVSDPSGEATEEVVSAEGFDALHAALGAFTLTDNQIAVRETSAGSTLLASICSASGSQLRNDLPASMTALASAFGSVTTDASFVGVELVDCTNNNVLRTVIASASDVNAFANGGLDATAFQTRWRVL